MLLFDHSAAPRISALHQHVEVSIQLLSLGPSHLDAFSSLSIEDDHSDKGDGSVAATDISSTNDGHLVPSLDGDANFFCGSCRTKVSTNPIRDFVQLPCGEWREVAEHWFGTCCCSFGSRAEFLSACYEKSLKLRPGRCFIGSSTFYIDSQDVTDAFLELNSVKADVDAEEQDSKLPSGNGFMVWEDERSKSIRWVPAHCTGCSSLIGACPSKEEGSGLVVRGIHLFKCQISTLKEDAPYDAYRYPTLGKLVAMELQSRTEENSSYRFLIHSLNSKSALLQLVVLSYESLICTGSCPETTGSGAVEAGGECVRPVNGKDLQTHKSNAKENHFLKPSLKLMFLDCSTLTADAIRLTDMWAQEHDVETIYMLEEVVEKLKSEMIINSLFFPAACRSFQNFQVSFLGI